ncbi:MAG: twin-arginine translocase subunit TatC [Candidatus Latescibacteria bacterium]|nr:twin-arginine translocase subunit TatC [Candidatus Latescibacterota bacterium]
MSVEKRIQEMSFFDHLEELRWAILKSVIAVLLGMVVCFVFSSDIIEFLILPTKPYEVLELQFIKPSGMFMIMIYISLGCGLIIALPVLLYQIWHFVSPGLLATERKYVPHVIFFSTILFLLGSAFAHYILIPILINFMLYVGSGVSDVKAQWDISMYMSMVIKMILVMGAVFQMPILVAFLTWIRVLSPTLLKDSWRYAMVIIFVLAAVITPTGDPLTQIIVAIPLLVLYVVSVFVSWMIARGREDEVTEDEDADVEDALSPEPPDSPTIARPLPDYTQSGRGYMGEDHWDDDEYIFEYADEMANSDPGPSIDSDDEDQKKSDDSGSEEPQTDDPQEPGKAENTDTREAEQSDGATDGQKSEDQDIRGGANGEESDSDDAATENKDDSSDDQQADPTSDDSEDEEIRGGESNSDDAATTEDRDDSSDDQDPDPTPNDDDKEAPKP